MCETSLVSRAGWIQSYLVMTPRRRSLHWLAMSSGSAVLVGTLLGCGSDGGGSGADEPPPPGGQTGEETVGCQPVERDMLAWSERSALGFSADELLNSLGSESTDRLSWSNGSGTPLTLGVERAASGRVEFQARDYVSDGSGAEPAAEIATECNDVVAIPVTLSFATADGAFAERWPVTLLAESSARVSAYAQVDVDDLEGSFSVTQVDPSRFDRVLAIVQLTFADGAWTGTLSGQGIMEGSGSADSAASASPFAIASF
jgi:hypothetical protein